MSDMEEGRPMWEALGIEEPAECCRKTWRETFDFYTKAYEKELKAKDDRIGQLIVEGANNHNFHVAKRAELKALLEGILKCGVYNLTEAHRKGIEKALSRG